MKAQFFHYRILEVKPITALEEFKDHKRLKVFFHKGCKCVKCGIEATQIALGEGRGQQHWDLYTDNFYPLTVDHIIPKSRGGGEELENKQPMCYRCNQDKGSKIDGEDDSIYSCIGHTCTWPKKNTISITPVIGIHVWTKQGRKIKYRGIISKLVDNPFRPGEQGFMVEGNNRSIYTKAHALAIK